VNWLKISIGLFLTLWLTAATAVAPSSKAPDFTLKSLQGENVRLKEYRGQVVLVNFWASWCGPCRQEMPLLDRIQKRYEPAGFTVLGVNVEGKRDKAMKIAKKVNVSFPLLIDQEQQVSEAYGVDAMPFTVLVDRDGRVAYIHRGYKPGEEAKYVDKLKELLRR
jgi:peroxiredoxin